MANANTLCALCGLIIAAAANFYGADAQKSQCNVSQFWNSDLEETSDVWRLAAISSFSVLAVVLVGAALVIGVMVHRRKSQKRPLREPIEETAGPLYQA
ncbi:hypothetical protein NHX12_025069 [Muraenolepis orangiensis]|uniref:Uncharacterized protein n=1 Tax=Muraenolepis orangiensis TaxID=630683 RepID=A0A9Q0IR99_9TELE|nr:hypothetical protein NHX12_025069 [Muraenolepis orangiensis]